MRPAIKTQLPLGALGINDDLWANLPDIFLTIAENTDGKPLCLWEKWNVEQAHS